MMGTFDSTSTWYIFIMPEFTCTGGNRSLWSPQATSSIVKCCQEQGDQWSMMQDSGLRFQEKDAEHECVKCESPVCPAISCKA